MTKVKTKKHLEEEIKMLRDLCGKLKDELEKAQKKTEPGEITSELPLKAMSVFKENNRFKLVRLAYNPKTNEALVKEVIKIAPNDRSYSVAKMFAKKELIESGIIEQELITKEEK